METNAADTALLGLRLALGGVFLAHGVKHFVNRAKTIAWTGSIGLRHPPIQWGFMTFAEIGVGAGLALGFMTTASVMGVVATLAVAYWTVHRRAGFFITARPDEGYEYVLVLIVTAVALAMLGPGSWSVDHALGIADDLSGWIGLAALPAGAAVGALHLGLTYRPTVS